MTLEDAWDLGLDHVCIATGAGYPRVLDIGNSLARGMRQASDFLMGLQLTGASKRDSLADLQVRMPVVVVGGGLTAVDTATEAQAYYIVQVEKVLARYETLVEEEGETAIREGLTEEDADILDELLEHGRAVRDERQRAAAAGQAPRLIPLLHQWGGATIAYRKGISVSPAYVHNPQELERATEEGIFYAEGLDPIHAQLDSHGHVDALVFQRMRQADGDWHATGHEVRLPARTVLTAAGTSPNTIYAHEHPGYLKLAGTHYRPHRYHRYRLQPVTPSDHCKTPEVAPFTSYHEHGRTVTFLGDTHPDFSGSVVKAIASAQGGYPQRLGAMRDLPPRPRRAVQGFLAHIARLLRPRVISVDRPGSAVVELWVRAPQAAARFRPGQFFRLQTLESDAPVADGTRIQAPGMTVSGTGIQGDCVRLLLLQQGATARLATKLRPGEPIVLMGPTGAPTEIPERRTIMVVTGRWGAAVMQDIGAALRAAGNRILYFAAFADTDQIDHPERLEAAADQIVWATAREPAFEPRRPQDATAISADMVDVVARYGDGTLQRDAETIPLAEVDRLLVIGGAGLLHGFQEALQGRLAHYLPEDVDAVGTVGSPMQCMLKGVCAQCLQFQMDPETGERTRTVFSCAEQDQPLAWIDVDHLVARQQQNRPVDRLTNLWVERLLRRMPR